MECRGRPQKSCAVREESVSESGEEGRRPMKRPGKCRAGRDLISWRRSVWGPLRKAPHEHGWGLTSCGRFRQALSARLCLGFFLIQKRISFSLVVVPVY